MRRLTAATTALLVIVAPAATGEPFGARAGETGRIEGVAVHGASGEPQQGVEVTLSVASRNERGIESETVTTGPDGAYVFDDLPTGNDRIYAIDAVYDGGLFPGRPLTLPDDTTEDPVIESRIRVWETTNDPSVIAIARHSIVLVPGEGRVAVIESVTVENSSERAYIGRGDAETEGSLRRTLGLSLPPGAVQGGVSVVESTLDIPELVRSEFGVALTVAIPPGESRVAVSYGVGGIVGTYDLARRALYPTARVTVLAADPFTVEGPRLERGDEVELSGATYSQWESTAGIAAGDPIAITATAEAGAAPALIAGAALVILLSLGLSAIALVRRRRMRAATPAPAEPATRDELIEAIAALDLGFESGEISNEEWRARRAELKEELGDLETQRSRKEDEPSAARDR
jgi:hypothetical protein